jgi:uncharacterized membrane protein YfcA
MSPTTALAIVAVVALAGAVQSMTGFGFALLAVPLLSFAVDAKVAVVLATTLGFAGSAWLAHRERASCDRRTARLMILGAAIGSPIGLVVLEVASERTLRFGLAAMIAVFLVINLRGVRLEQSSTSTDLAFGTISGVLNTSLATNGPPLVMVLHARHLAPAAFRATLGLVFAVSGTLAIVLFAASSRYDGETLRALAVASPALLSGMAIGRIGATRVPVSMFRHAVMGLLAVTAAASFVGAVTA